MNKFVAVAFASFLLLPALYADPCPCVPVTYLWIVRSCATFDCAASAFILGNGSPEVIVMPTGSSDAPFVVLQRIATGYWIETPDPTFRLESFDTVDAAMMRYAAVGTSLTPMVMTTPDAKVLLVTRRAPETRRRAVGPR